MSTIETNAIFEGERTMCVVLTKMSLFMITSVVFVGLLIFICLASDEFVTFKLVTGAQSTELVWILDFKQILLNIITAQLIHALNHYSSRFV